MFDLRFKTRSVSVFGALLMLTAFFTGCSTVQPLGVTSRTDYRKECNYTIGKEFHVAVGQSVIKRANYSVNILEDPVVSPQSQVSFSVSIPLNSTVSVTLFPDRQYPVAGVVEDQGQYKKVVIVGETQNRLSVGLLLDIEDNSSPRGIWRTGTGGWSTGGGASFNISPVGVKFTPHTREVVAQTAKYENFELVYTGRSKSSITMLYREFSPDDLARPAFYQNLSFDLDESPIIGFRSFRIEVKKANNEGLTAVVLSD